MNWQITARYCTVWYDLIWSDELQKGKSVDMLPDFFVSVDQHIIYSTHSMHIHIRTYTKYYERQLYYFTQHTI